MRKSTAIDKVTDSVQAAAESALAPCGCSILVACSGGADSTVLLDVLRRLSAKNKWKIGVVYVNHHQYDESLATARKLRDRCRRWKLPFWILSLDPALVPPGSSEALMREHRYALLSKFAALERFDRIALGHTASDQVETILMRILRGTSTRGLGGIPESRDGLFIRPLLELRREEIVQYLHVRRLSWLEDPTNQDRAFLRNFIRHELLPMIRQRMNPAVDRALLRLSASASMDQETLRQFASKVQVSKTSKDEVEVDLDDLVMLPDAARAWVVIFMLRDLLGQGANLEQEHMMELLQKLSNNSSFRLELQGGLEGILRKGKLIVRRKDVHESSFFLTVKEAGEFVLPGGRGKIKVRTQGSWRPELASAHRVFFDEDELSFPFVLRSVREGDRIRPWGMDGSRKVTRLLRDEGIPADRKHTFALMQSGDRIVWILGIRRSTAAKVSKSTKNVMEIVFIDDSAA